MLDKKYDQLQILKRSKNLKRCHKMRLVNDLGKIFRLFIAFNQSLNIHTLVFDAFSFLRTFITDYHLVFFNTQ